MRLLLLTILLSSPLLVADAPRWTSWRGANDSGSATKGTYPAKLNEDTQLWKVELPGRGCSTPIVWDQTIILTTPLGDQDGVLALDWHGKQLWDTPIGSARDGKHRNGSSSNPSPITDDGTTIFTYFKSGNLAALDFKGNILWQTNLQERYGKDTLYWDLGTSPVLTKKHVVVAVMHDSGSYLVAFDRKSGEFAWKADRNYETQVEGDHSYATPHVIERDGKELIVVWGAEHLTTHDATNGKELSACGHFNPRKKKNWVAVASSVISGDMVIVPYGRGSHLAGIKLGGSGDVTEKNRIWTRDDDHGAFVPTPAVSNGHIYILGDRGQVHCLNPRTGETVWTNKLPKAAQNYYASPTIADGKLYAAREDGQFFVATADEKLEVLFQHHFEEQIIASPIATGDRILLRTATHLLSYGQK
jgi:outer membrane protein assembly factor BamB